MIHLVALFDFREHVTSDQVKEFYRRLSELPSLIPALGDFQPGEDLGWRDDNCPVGLVARFPDRAAFDAYVNHPAHVAFVEQCVIPWAIRHGAHFEH